MPTLARGDAERLLRFVAVADELAADDPFVPETLTALGELIDADRLGYIELDRVRSRPLVDINRPGDATDDAIDWELFLPLLDEHPLYRRQLQGEVGAFRLSDVMTLRELRRTRVWSDWLSHIPSNRVLNLAARSPLRRTRTFWMDRSGADFTARDRHVLDLVAPHVDRIWRDARTRRLLAAALATLERSGEPERRGVVLLGTSGDAELVSPPARRLLRDFFPASHERLPAQLVDWLSGGAEPLVVDRGARRLRVERTGEALLFEEAWACPSLTAREQQVLTWVARGKTNAEIAEALWLSPGTVRKHLENAFAKLGVRTRTAAVARFLALVDASEDEPARRAESS